MGSILNLKCEKCDYCENFLLGAGLMDFSLEFAISRFDPVTVAEIKDWLKANSFIRYNLEVVFSFCQSCSRFEAIPTIVFYLKKQQSKKFLSKCLNGYPTPEIIDYTKAGLPCPVCGNNLDKDMNGHWD